MIYDLPTVTRVVEEWFISPVLGTGARKFESCLFYKL